MNTPYTGFTLIELLVVVAVLAIVAIFTVSGFLEYGATQQFRATTVDIASLIKESRQRTLGAETTTHFGLVFNGNVITRYEGVYIAGAPDNQVFTFPGIAIMPNLTDGTTTLAFTRLTGIPNATGTIVLLHERTGATTSIEVSSSGLVW